MGVGLLWIELGTSALLESAVVFFENTKMQT